jgi:hypothetical protein
MSDRKSPAFSCIVMALCLFSFCACQSPEVVQPEPSPPTPTPVIDQTQLSTVVRPNAYRQFAPGLLARTTYQAEPAGRLGVEVWDLLVGPGKKSDVVTLPGGVVCEVRAGTGLVLVSGKPREVRIGTTFSFDEGETLQIENRSADDALSIRAVLIRSRQQ